MWFLPAVNTGTDGGAEFLPIDAWLNRGDPVLLHRFLAYWRDLRGERTMPSLDDFDPAAVPWAQANVFVLRLTPDGDFEYRMAGELVSDQYGRNLEGARIGDLFPPANAGIIRERWIQVATRPAGCYTDTEHPTSRETCIAARRITLPLGSDEGPADHVVGVAAFDRVSRDPLPGISRATIREVRWTSLEAAPEPREPGPVGA